MAEAVPETTLLPTAPSSQPLFQAVEKDPLSPSQSSSRRGDEFTFPLLGNCLDIGEQRKKSLHRYICHYMDISFFLWLPCSGICGHKFLFFLWIPCSGIYGHNFLFFFFLVEVQEYQLHVHVCGFAPGADSCRF